MRNALGMLQSSFGYCPLPGWLHPRVLLEETVVVEVKAVLTVAMEELNHSRSSLCLAHTR